MKRIIAIILALLLSISVFAGCSNVSTDPNGKIDANEQSTESESDAASTKERQKSTNDHTDNNSIMDDIGDIANDTGDMIGDIGRDIDDTLDG